MVLLAAAFCAATAIPSPAQHLSTLVSFNGTNGSSAGYANSLVQGKNENFYGTTTSGGANGEGTIFKITPAGKLTTLHNFCSQTNCVDGAVPRSALLQAKNGNFYGTTYQGGAYCVSGNNANTGCGTVFEITAAGQFTSLYSFCSNNFPCYDGDNPYASLIQGIDGNLYGTTPEGGNNSYDINCFCNGGGTVFKITTAGQLTTLYSFCNITNTNGYCFDGAAPIGALVQTSSGDFYGTTYDGGSGHNGKGGTVFKLSTTGTLTTLYSFCSVTKYCKDGAYPFDGLVQGANGNFYGVTENGGFRTYGTVFKITPAGALTTLYRFHGSPGLDPYASLVQGSDGNFYGTTLQTAFRIGPNGGLSALYTFCYMPNCQVGTAPSGLIQGKNGKFYGTDNTGGANGLGSVFSLTVPLSQPE